MDGNTAVRMLAESFLKNSLGDNAIKLRQAAAEANIVGDSVRKQNVLVQVRELINGIRRFDSTVWSLYKIRDYYGRHRYG